MIRSCINICLLAVISLLFGAIWQETACAAVPTIQPLGQIRDGLRGPTMLAVDAAGDLYVAEPRRDIVVKFDKYGSRVDELVGAQVSGAGLAAAADGRVYVSAGDRVAIFDVDGSLSGYLGQGAGEFKFAGMIAVDVNGNIYVVDQTAGRIKLYSPDGGFVGFFAGLQLSGRIGLSIDPGSNRVYITNYNYARGVVPNLSVYDAGGALLKKVPATNGFGTPVFDFGSVVFDAAGRYYLSDGNAATIRVMDAVTGAALLKYGTGLVHPCAMAFDRLTNRLFVLYADVRVDIYGIDGGTTPIKVTNVAPDAPVGLTSGELDSQSPKLEFVNAVDADGDSLTYNVRVFADSGAEVAEIVGIPQGGETMTSTLVPLGGAAENNSFQWQVQADDGQATSEWSSLKTFYVNAVQEPPTAPILTSFLNGEVAGSDARLAWDGSLDPDLYSSVSYRVEISSGAALAASGEFADTSIALTELSAGLTPDAVYTWRVVAVDNTALETVSLAVGRFVYRPSILRVDANIPGAKAYLGGHYGYAGRSLGLVPVEVRDLAEGAYSVVIEAPGFQPYVRTVVQAKDTLVVLSAELKGARLASEFVSHGLTLPGTPLADSNVSPIVADLNRDDVPDLLLVNAGLFELYPGVMAETPAADDTIADLAVAGPAKRNKTEQSHVVFSEQPLQLALPQIAGAAPCLVDWDNDDRYDLLVGGADGSVKLFSGREGLGFSGEGLWLVTVGGPAVPAVTDFDRDGDKDLVVSSGNELLLFDNVGSDSQPLLNTQSTLVALDAPVVPLFADWDADGTRDLMLLSRNELFVAEIIDGHVSAMTSAGPVIPGAVRLFALNSVDSRYTDLLFGTDHGALVAVNGRQGDFSSAYIAALRAKIEELRLQVAVDAPERLGKVGAIATLVENGNYGPALLNTQQLATFLGADTPAAAVAVELAIILE